MNPSETYSSTIDLAVDESTPSRPSLFKTLMVLFKVRIVMLLLFAAVGGAFLASGGWPGGDVLILLLVTGGLAAAGASALNEYLEIDLDARMIRTRRRPLVEGAIDRPGWVPYVGAMMIGLPALAVLSFNPALAFFLVFGAFIYIGIYTLWLKPRSLLNVVIGGAAGSAAVLSGSAAAGVWNDPRALMLALLLFTWSPTHFWSLAIVYRDDYARGGFPMLPTQTSNRAAAFWVFLHTGATVLAGLALGAFESLGWLYLIPVGLATVDLLVRNVRLLRRPGRELAYRLFHASNLYLAVVLLMIVIDTLV